MQNALKSERVAERQSFLHPQIEIRLDMMDVVQHQIAGALCIMVFERIENGGVLVVAAARNAGSTVKRDDQR